MKGIEEQVKALYDYTKQDDTELSYRAGDVIIVTEQDSNGWWYGYLQSDTDKTCGFVASNYVVPVRQKPTKVVLFDYTADGQGEMSIKKGDIVQMILAMDQDRVGWSLVEMKDGSAKGWVPTDYLEQ